MAYSTISKPSLHFNTATYAGNGGTNAITGLGFQPDMVWTKNRSASANHLLYDAIRGAGYYLYPNLTNGQGGNGTSALDSFDSDGFTLDGGDDSNVNGQNGVAWTWKAGNSSGSSNTDGSITSTVSANTTAGFSIIKYTGTGATATVGHGLNAIPDMMIIKRYSDAGEQWTIYHKSLGNTKHILLTNGGETTQANYWNDTSPTSSVWTMGNQSEINGSGTNNICYAFAEKKGYSKIGSYTGNGNADGPFVYTGFAPAFVIAKNSAISDWWSIFDNKRLGFNSSDSPRLLFPSANSAESTTKMLDFTSNGFKIRSSNTGVNGNGNKTIYMAFAEEPLVANVGASIPATAK